MSSYPITLGTIKHLSLTLDRPATDPKGIKLTLRNEGEVVRVWDASDSRKVTQARNFELRRCAYSALLRQTIRWDIEDMGPVDLGVSVFSYDAGDGCEGVNLDGESIAGLLRFAAAVNNPDFGADTIANRVFPRAFAENSDLAVFAIRELAQYAALKAAAMDYRANGAIDRALTVEKLCEGIYAELPEFARW